MRTLRHTSTFIVFFGILFFTTVTGYSQVPVAKGTWKSTTESAAAAMAGPSAVSFAQARHYKTMQLNIASLNGVLRRAPMEFTPAARSGPLEVTLPMPDGSMASFEIVESPVMAPELAAKFPQIKTYMGRGIDDPTATVRLSLTPKGFRSQILSASGTSYIDPLYKGNTELYMCYARRDLEISPEPFHCLTESTSLSQSAALAEGGGVAMMMGGTEVTLRTYRLACAATGEFTQFYGGTVMDGLAAVVEGINRVVGIYEREVAVRMELVADNDKIIFTDPGTDPYTISDIGAMTLENQSTLDDGINYIGENNYDIGHVVGQYATNNGLAYLGVVCYNGFKGKGATRHANPNIDPFWVDYVSHEMGHQFNANHTWNGNQGNCISSSYVYYDAYEPGSGTTIMGYAGICDADDIQPNSEPYFHSASLDEILNFIAFLDCDVESASGNHSPTVDAGPSYTIPRSTPFTLTPIGWDDSDGDPLTFSWEQRDLSYGQRALCDPDDGYMPLFRFYPPTQEPSRTFPRLESILTLDIQNQGQLCVTGEQLPTTDRTMNFRVTARDNVFGGGGTGYDDMAVYVVSSAGPFKVTSFDDPCEPYAGCSSVQVDWDVANTNQSPVNADFVNILLSVDGGQTFPFTLAANTPNDGVEMVEFPGFVTKKGRVKVEAVNNIFFDISDDDIEITYSGGTCQGVHNVTQNIWYSQVQPAINGAVNGDMIVVYPGFYPGAINLNGKAITLTGVDPTDWDIVAATIIDADYAASYVATLNSGEDENTVLTGLTIQSAPGYCVRFVGSSAILRNCIITGARGGITGSGGSAPTIENNRIHSVQYIGIDMTADSPAIIRNNLIYSYTLGGLRVHSPATVIEGNTIVAGSHFISPTITGIATTAASLTATNCIIQNNDYSISGNVTLTYSCVDDGVPGTGNIYSDPLFVDPDNYDYHLQPDSLCRNAGNPSLNYNGQTDIDSQPRLQETLVDMGADESRANVVVNARTGMEYDQIQDAVDDAALGDTLLVYPGTYETVDFRSKAVTVSGTDPDNWNTVQNTVIDATDSAGVWFRTGEGPDSVLTGVTVTGGTVGVWCQNSGPTVHRCLIRDNGIISVYGNVYGGGAGAPIITNNIVRGSWYAVYMQAGTSGKILNNWVEGALHGLSISSTSNEIANNTIVNNEDGVYGIAGVQLRNCIVWGNTLDGVDGSPTLTYCCIQESWPGTGNIFSNPQFVDQAGGDYHLKSVSPCRNTGDPGGNYTGQTDIDGETRTYFNVDMGADEYVP